MTRLGWLMEVLAGTGAAIAAYCGVALLWAVVNVFSILESDAAGGLGAVSVGAGVLIPLALIASAAANLLLAGAARRAGGLVAALHRVQSVTLLLGLALLAMLVSVLVFSLVSGTTLVAAALLIGLVFAAQFLLVAAMLVGFIRLRRAAPAG